MAACECSDCLADPVTRQQVFRERHPEVEFEVLPDLRGHGARYADGDGKTRIASAATLDEVMDLLDAAFGERADSMSLPPLPPAGVMYSKVGDARLRVVR